jgi:hypothetical protein
MIDACALMSIEQCLRRFVVRSNYVVSEHSDELGSVFIGVIGHSYLMGPPKTSEANVVASYGLLATQPEEDSSDYACVFSRGGISASLDTPNQPGH